MRKKRSDSFNAIDQRDLLRAYKKTIISFDRLSRTPAFIKDRQRIYKKYQYDLDLVKCLMNGKASFPVTIEQRMIFEQLIDEFPCIEEKLKQVSLTQQQEDQLEAEGKKIPETVIAQFAAKWKIRRTDATLILQKDEFPPHPLISRPRTKTVSSQRRSSRKWWVERVHKDTITEKVLRAHAKGKKPYQIHAELSKERTISRADVYKIIQRDKRRLGQ